MKENKPTRDDQPPLQIKTIKPKRGRKMLSYENQTTACLVFLFPKILIPSFHMWSLDLSPATEEICYRGIQAAVPTAHRGERGASRRRGRASPVMQPVAGMRRTRRDGRSFPERQSLFLQHPNDPRRLYHGQPEHNERTHTHTAVYCHHIKIIRNHQKQ